MDNTSLMGLVFFILYTLMVIDTTLYIVLRKVMCLPQPKYWWMPFSAIYWCCKEYKKGMKK